MTYLSNAITPEVRAPPPAGAHLTAQLPNLIRSLRVSGALNRACCRAKTVAADSLLDERIGSIGREVERGPASVSTWQRLLGEGSSTILACQRLFDSVRIWASTRPF